MARDKDEHIYRKGVSPNTLSMISMKNRVFAYNAAGDKNQVGALATFDISEARTVEAVRGIGFGDHVAELVPGVTDPMSISVTRTALYLSNIFQATGYKSGIDGLVRSLRHHRWPFDIYQEIIFSQLAIDKIQGSAETYNSPTKDGSSERATDEVVKGLLTIYEACWMVDYGISFASDSALVQENVSFQVTDILSRTGLNYAGDEASLYSTLSDKTKARSILYK